MQCLQVTVGFLQRMMLCVCCTTALQPQSQPLSNSMHMCVSAAGPDGVVISWATGNAVILDEPPQNSSLPDIGSAVRCLLSCTAYGHNMLLFKAAHIDATSDAHVRPAQPNTG